MRKTILIIAACLAVTGCNEDAKTAWDDVLKKCAFSELNAKTILYFGPSNNVGPGTVWRPGSNGGYRLRWSLAEMPNHSVFINTGAPSTCDGTKTTKFGVGTDLGLTSGVTPVYGELSNDLKKAKNIEVKATSIAWDLVKEGPYEAYVKALPATEGLREDLGKGDRLVLYRALRVTGYSAKLEFNESDAATLKVKYSGPLPKSLTGDLGLSLSASWDTANRLALTSVGDFYIAGELVPFNPTGFAQQSTAFGKPLEIEKSGTALREQVE